MRKRQLSSTDSFDPATPDANFVVALARGLAVLRAFRPGDPGLGNQELADRTGLAKSTLSRLTYTLMQLDYLEYSQITGRYSLSVSALALGFSALGGMAIRDIARPFMQEFAENVGGSVGLGAADRRTMVYIEHCTGDSPLQLGMQVGSHVRMATSAMGRAYLAALDPAGRERVLAEILPDGPEAAPLRQGVEAAVRQFQEKGYVTSRREWQSEVNSVGVPLLIHGSRPYALNCGSSVLVMPDARLDQIGEQLIGVARRIERLLAARG